MGAGLTSDEAIGASAMKKAFWRILPLILLAYLFAYMDRVNVSFAAAQMNEDLKFSATIYGLGGGLFFLGYALFEIPSNRAAFHDVGDGGADPAAAPPGAGQGDAVCCVRHLASQRAHFLEASSW